MGNETDISGFGTQGSQIPVPTGAPIEVGGTTLTGGLASQSASTIQKSDLEKIEEALFIAAFPFLQPPQTTIYFQDLSDPNALGIHGSSIMSFSMQVEELNHSIIMDMWDKYSETLKEIAKRREEDHKDKWGKDLTKEGPKSATEYNAYLLRLAPTARADEIAPSGKSEGIGPTGDDLNVKFGATFNLWIANPAQSGINATGNYPDSNFIAGSVASSPDLVSQTMGVGIAGAAGLQLSVSPIADALTTLGPVSALPADTQLASALVAALLYNGASNKATNDALADAAEKGQPVRTVDFAVNFAKNILAIITHDVEGGEPMNDEKTGQNRLIRLMLATTALTMLHRGVFGGMTSEDLENLVNSNDINKADIPEETKTLFKNLAANINELLDQSPESREATLAQMAQYAGSKDPVESMLNSSKLLVAMLDPSVDSRRLEAKQG